MLRGRGRSTRKDGRWEGRPFGGALEPGEEGRRFGRQQPAARRAQGRVSEASSGLWGGR